MTVLILILAAGGVWGVLAFNRLVRLRNQVRTAWADIDVQLKRRHDLVPQLVAAVQGYVAHERGVLTVVTELRARALTISSPADLGRVESSLEKSLHQLFALREAYPDLKSNENFLRLQHDLAEVEDHLQYARRFYNGAVREFNTAIQRFPGILIARAFGFDPCEFFSADADERDNVRVELSP